MKQKKKYFNLRLFFIGFLGMILGILNFYNLFKMIEFNKFSWWFLLFTLIFVGIVVLAIHSAVFKNYRKFLKYLIIFITLFIIGGSSIFIKLKDYNSYESFGEESKIEGVVSSHYYKENYYLIELDKVKINNEKIKSKISLYVTLTSSLSDEISLGDKIEVVGDISFKPLVTDEINIGNYVSDKVYSSSVLSTDLKLTNQKPNLIYFLQEKLRQTLNKGLTNENADIAYGVLVGDKSELDESVSDTFSYAGISHILAVSGLHVGFLVAILTFLLNLCRVGRKKRFFIISIILILYSIFCGLTPSILRASFMAIVLLLAGVVGEEYDGLNSLGFAGILILLIFPQDLFSVGFQLSFMCVFMIITLADKLLRVFNSWKIPKVISSSLTISFCITLGSSIILANTFSEVSFISIVANIIVIPMFSIIYPMLFLFAIMGMMVPIFSNLLFLPQILLHFVKFLADNFAKLNFAHFRVFNLGYVLLLLFTILCLVVKFLMLSKKIKIPICIFLTIICIAFVFIGAQPNQFNSYAMYTNYQFNTSSTILTTESGKKYLIGFDDYSTINYLTKLKINQLDAVILQDFELNKIINYQEFLKEIKVNKLIVPYRDGYNNEVLKGIVDYTNICYIDDQNEDISFEFVREDELICGTIVKINNYKLLFPNGITKEKLEILGNKLDSVNYIITNTSKYDFKDYGIDYDNIIHSKSLKFKTNHAISLKNKSNYVIKLY